MGDLWDNSFNIGPIDTSGYTYEAHKLVELPVKFDEMNLTEKLLELFNEGVLTETEYLKIKMLFLLND